MSPQTLVLPSTKVDILAAPGCLTGAFVREGIPTVQDIRQFETLVGKRSGIIMWYHAFAAGFQFPKDACARIRSHGAVPFIRLEPWSYIGRNDFSFSLERIVQGDFDREISLWAHGAREMGLPILHSFGHEMNVSESERWYPWAGNSVVYKAAYARVYEIFRDAGADNVHWIYSVNEYNPALIREFYPGDDVVDYVGIDGFNFGDTQSWSHWRSFEEIFSDAYETIRLVAPEKSIILTEFGSAEIGGDKGRWVLDAFHSMKYSMPQVRGFVWFHLLKEADWRVNSSADTLKAFEHAISDPYFVGEAQT